MSGAGEHVAIDLGILTPAAEMAGAVLSATETTSWHGRLVKVLHFCGTYWPELVGGAIILSGGGILGYGLWTSAHAFTIAGGTSVGGGLILEGAIKAFKIKKKWDDLIQAHQKLNQRYQELTETHAKLNTEHQTLNASYQKLNEDHAAAVEALNQKITHLEEELTELGQLTQQLSQHAAAFDEQNQLLEKAVKVSETTVGQLARTGTTLESRAAEMASILQKLHESFSRGEQLLSLILDEKTIIKSLLDQCQGLLKQVEEEQRQERGMEETQRKLLAQIESLHKQCEASMHQAETAALREEASEKRQTALQDRLEKLLNAESTETDEALDEMKQVLVDQLKEMKKILEGKS